jgi:Sulfotransferase domain
VTPPGRLPTFLVIGAMKGGTTSLYEYLRRHPEIFMPSTKELHFFTAEHSWAQGWDWYAQQFAGDDEAKAIGESSPSYSSVPFRVGAPERVASRIPQMKLIYLLRHPVDRLRSQYAHRILNGRETRSPEEAVLEARYIGKSWYDLQIASWMDWFAPEQMLLVLSDDLRHDRAATMTRILGFLGVSTMWDETVLETEFHRLEDKLAAQAPSRGWKERVLPGSGREAVPAWSPELEARVRARLRPDQERLTLRSPEMAAAVEAWGLL